MRTYSKSRAVPFLFEGRTLKFYLVWQFYLWRAIFHAIFAISFPFKRENWAHGPKFMTQSSNCVKTYANMVKIEGRPFFCKGRTWHLLKFRTYCLCRAVFCPKFGLSIRFKRQNEAHTPIEKLPRSICVKLRGHIVKTEGRTFFVRWPDMLFLRFFTISCLKRPISLNIRAIALI